jgi:large subunit ribosomal protein L43
MVSRGVPQLKNIRLYFCDYGGSSLGVRNALQSPQLVNLMKENPHLQLEISMRRNFHPYISSTYINGYVKDQSLKNMKEDEILEWLNKVNSEFGRRPLKHNSVKVVSS